MVNKIISIFKIRSEEEAIDYLIKADDGLWNHPFIPKVIDSDDLNNGILEQPNITQLLDIYDDTNPLNITMGNPGLKPSFTTNLTTNFQMMRRTTFVTDSLGMQIPKAQRHWSFNVNANELVIALFDLPNQIYGSLTGHIELVPAPHDLRTSTATGVPTWA